MEYKLKFQKGDYWYDELFFKTKQDVWAFLNRKNTAINDTDDDINFKALAIMQYFSGEDNVDRVMPALITEHGITGKTTFYRRLSNYGYLDFRMTDYNYPLISDDIGNVSAWGQMDFDITIYENHEQD